MANANGLRTRTGRGWGVVELRHALDLLERHVVAVAQPVAAVLVARHHAGCRLADVREQPAGRRLSRGVRHSKGRAHVHEAAAEQPRCARRDEGHGASAALRAERHLLGGAEQLRAAHHHHAEAAARALRQRELLHGRRARREADEHCGVEGLQEGQRRGRPAEAGAHCGLVDGEVGCGVARLARPLVEQSHAVHAGQHDVLGHLHAQPAQTQQQHPRPRHPLLRLVAEHVQLAAVQRLVHVLDSRHGGAGRCGRVTTGTGTRRTEWASDAQRPPPPPRASAASRPAQRWRRQREGEGRQHRHTGGSGAGEADPTECRWRTCKAVVDGSAVRKEGRTERLSPLLARPEARTADDAHTPFTGSQRV